MKKEIILGLIALTLFGNATDFYYENGKKVEVVKINEKRVNDSNITYYKTSKGHKIGVKNDILVECKEGVNCKSILSNYETLTISALTDTIFIVTIAKDKNIFEFSQTIYENSNIKIAHPNLRKTKRRR